MSGEITLLLQRVNGDPARAGELLDVVYGELRKLGAARMAREAPGNTLQATALVHEAWTRLVDDEGRARFQNRAHFFCAAAEAMRRILVDRARAKLRGKRGGRAEHVPLENLDVTAPSDRNDELLLVHDTLEKLKAHDERKAKVVTLHYFSGFTFEEISEILGLSLPTVNRDWAYARAWLRKEITAEQKRSPSSAKIFEEA